MLKDDKLKRSRLQEMKGAREYGGHRNSGSGNGWVRKADVRTEDELIEFKSTTKDSYSLKAAELQKLWDQALLDDRIPVFEIEYSERGVVCVVLDKSDFLALRQDAAYCRGFSSPSPYPQAVNPEGRCI